eukprot:TRINITY_DN4062_c0_g1_i3.p1 TRINITY_DN4062_c0_g1~~TRINITY_DN4062_c0_g1_i3.p1  ORF type:complete len:306 (+),score=82.60 TRINITY_DN4062_c0_g1_i3:15-932(+)
MESPLAQRLIQALPEWCSLLKYSMAKLYFSDKSLKFKYSSLSGALCLVLNRKQWSTKFLVLYDVAKFAKTFECEIYFNFLKSYKQLTGEFFYFPISTGWCGLLFQSKEEAHSFNDRLEQYVDDKSPDEFKKMIEWDTKGSVGEILSPMGSEGGKKFYLNKEYLWIRNVSGRTLRQFCSLHISKPTIIERTNNTGWDPIKQNFKLDELPEEVKEVLKRAGITKKDLKEKSTALMVYEILINPRQLDSVLAKTNAKKKVKKRRKHKEDQLPDNNKKRPCLLYTSPSPRDRTRSRMPSSACKKKKKKQ